MKLTLAELSNKFMSLSATEVCVLIDRIDLLENWLSQYGWTLEELNNHPALLRKQQCNH